MTFAQIAASLPNGFHDAELQRLDIDYVQRRMLFDLVVWIGDMDDSPQRELYRPARVTVEDVTFLVAEPPDDRYPWAKAGPIRIDAGIGQPKESSSVLPSMSSGVSTVWIYLESFNSFLLFSGGNASLEWAGPEEARVSPRIGR